MPHREPDDDEADLHDRELPDESDMDDEAAEEGDDADTETCPFCGKEVYADADLCAHCGNFIAFAHTPSRKPVWFILAVALGLLIVLTWILFGMNGGPG